MIAPEETFGGTFTFRPHFSEAPGFRMHYVDEGQGPVVLLLHGEPTRGYLFRDLIPALASHHRVIAPDHMGFGKSETPHGRSYTLKDHIDNLESFVLGLGLADVTLVMHDFGGPVGTGLALRHPGLVRRLIAADAPVPLGLPGQSELVAANLAAAPWFRWIARARADGSLEAVLSRLGYNILSTMKLNGLERMARVDDELIRAYGAPFETPEECLGAIGWARGVADGTLAFEPATDAARGAVRSRPAMLIQGMRDPTLRPEFLIPLFEAAFPGAPVLRLGGVGHYCFEDAPEVIASLIELFLRLT